MVKFGEAVKVTIDLEGRNGYFLFNGEGAIGKSFLASLFSRYHKRENLYVKTFKDGGIYERGNKDTAKILLYDRVDTYFDKNLVDEINIYGKNKPILLDLKDMSNIDKNRREVNLGIVDIVMRKGEIRVEVVL